MCKSLLSLYILCLLPLRQSFCAPSCLGWSSEADKNHFLQCECLDSRQVRQFVSNWQYWRSINFDFSPPAHRRGECESGRSARFLPFGSFDRWQGQSPAMNNDENNDHHCCCQTTFLLQELSVNFAVLCNTFILTSDLIWWSYYLHYNKL